MLTYVGRVRADQALPNGIKYMLVSHNSKMGAAKGGTAPGVARSSCQLAPAMHAAFAASSSRIASTAFLHASHVG